MPRQTRRLNLDHVALSTDSSERQVLDQMIKGLRKYKKVVVIAGAGISVSAGIPDFRSKNGIFKSLKSEHKLKGSGKDLFAASVYGDEMTTDTFHKMIRGMSEMVKTAKPTPFHDFCARLAHEGRLMRIYTQNVDGLEIALDPLKQGPNCLPLPKKGPWPKTIQLHGGLHKAVCTKCNEITEFVADKFDGPVPPSCHACERHDAVRTVYEGKRSHGIGKLRPRMVLYEEQNPDAEAIGACTTADLRARPDCVIVVGTSMKIPGVRRIVREMCKTVRDRKDGMTIWINRDPEPTGKEFEGLWDIIVEGSSDEVARSAGLGKWDDPVDLLSPSTEEDAQKIASSGPAMVVLNAAQHSPVKDTSLPTPCSSPQPDAPTFSSKGAGGSRSIKNPASAGRSIQDALSGSAGKKAPAKKPSAKVKKAASGKLKGKASNGKMPAYAGVSKPGVAAPVLESQMKKCPGTPKMKASEPLHLSPSKANASPPRFPNLKKEQA